MTRDRIRGPKPTAPMSFAEAMQKGLQRDFRVSGFTFVRNGVRFGYPFRESILSLLPAVDELIVNVGIGEDDTLAEVRELAAEYSKIKVIESAWDESLRSGGRVLAEQTNIALAACRGDWAVYLQADEVLHEDDYMWTLDALKRAHKREDVEGLLFDYLHFYSDFSTINWNPSAYRHEVRAVRLGRNVRSVGDAQGFRIDDGSPSGKKLRVLRANSRIYHYGWVRPQPVMQEKTVAFDSLYHASGPGTGDNYKYKHIYGLQKFTGTHPLVMRDRISAASAWSKSVLDEPLYFHWRDVRKVLTRQCEKLFGYRPFEYRNYELAE